MSDPTVQEILDQTELKWIFVGGKGGVGKTTNSCALATQLAGVREKVLLISTDPAHNLSDAFGQKFNKDPSLVEGYTNLYAMEVDPQAALQDMTESGATSSGLSAGMFQDLALSIPGVDEAMSFAEVMKLVKSMDYSVVVFDTAPTGHTLRFLQFPSVLEKGLGKIKELTGRFGPMLQQFGPMLGMQTDGQELTGKLEELRSVISEVNSQFQNPDLTTFVCVAISEFLSLYETERMIQELANFNIDTHTIIINQLLYPKQASNCEQCLVRRKMQKKYLDQFHELYEDFNLVELPLLTEEVRGPEKIKEFSKMLVTPYKHE